tara:strand:+ start:515 stop:3202 length:2688 start_codon:yes stop_codon:yes gene_type:complete
MSIEKGPLNTAPNGAKKLSQVASIYGTDVTEDITSLRQPNRVIQGPACYDFDGSTHGLEWTILGHTTLYLTGVNPADNSLEEATLTGASNVYTFTPGSVISLYNIKLFTANTYTTAEARDTKVLSTNQIAWHPCQEKTAAVSYDALGDNHATILNYSAAIHGDDNGVKFSWANDFGYTNALEVIVPAEYQSVLLDADGNTLEYFGKPQYNSKIVNQPVFYLDGSAKQVYYNPLPQGGIAFEIGLNASVLPAKRLITVDYIKWTSGYLPIFSYSTGDMPLYIWTTGEFYIDSVIWSTSVVSGEEYKIEVFHENDSGGTGNKTTLTLTNLNTGVVTVESKAQGNTYSVAWRLYTGANAIALIGDMTILGYGTNAGPDIKWCDAKIYNSTTSGTDVYLENFLLNTVHTSKIVYSSKNEWTKTQNTVAPNALKGYNVIHNFESAVNFDGTATANLTTTLTYTGEFTFACWYRGGNVSEIILTDNSNSSYLVNFQATDIRHEIAGSTPIFTSPGIDDKWHFIVVTRDSVDNLTTYLDGGTLGTQVISGTLTVNNFSGFTGGEYTGLLSQSALWSTTINSTDVLAMFNNKKKILFSDIKASPDAHWMFNEVTSQIADISGNNNHLDLINIIPADVTEVLSTKIPISIDNPYIDILGDIASHPNPGSRKLLDETHLKLNPMNAPALIQAGIDSTNHIATDSGKPSEITSLSLNSRDISVYTAHPALPDNYWDSFSFKNGLKFATSISYPNWNVLASNISVSGNGTSANKVLRTAGGVYEGALDSTLLQNDFELFYTINAIGENYKFIGTSSDSTQATQSQPKNTFFIVNTSDIRVRETTGDKMTFTAVVGDVLSIKRVGTLFTYYKNGILLYTSIIANSLNQYAIALPGDPNIFVEGISIRS